VQTEQGRGGSAFFEEMLIPAARTLRERIAGLLGCGASEVALTGSTTDGVNSVLSGLDLGPRDEVLTSDEEHPGLLVPLALGARRRGFTVREAPFAELAAAVGPDTTLVACSHVSWVTGRLVDAEALAAAGAPVLLDGAQGLGAVHTDIAGLGCDFYAASGQKWLCGPNGTGYLYVRPERLADLHPAWPGYLTLAAPERPLDLDLREQTDRLDLGLLPYEHSAWAAASLDVLEAAGFDDLLTAAVDRAEGLAVRLAEAGRTVAPRGRSTLVSWEEADPEATSRRLVEAGVVVRHLPGRPYVRASVGAWTVEEDLERLLRAL